MKAKSAVKAGRLATTKRGAVPGLQVLKPGKRRVVGGTKFGQDGCGY